MQASLPTAASMLLSTKLRDLVLSPLSMWPVAWGLRWASDGTPSMRFSSTMGEPRNLHKIILYLTKLLILACHESWLLLAEVPLALPKCWGGWNLQSRETTTLPPADWFTSSLAVAQSPPGRHRQQIRQHPHPQHHCAFIFFMPSSSSLPS